MNYNYHAHTARCGHACGTQEEYVLRAIQCGIRHMGFSDHMPLAFSDGHESYFRVPIAQVEDYMQTTRALAEKYKDKLTLSVGFEMEYYPSVFDHMLRLAKSYGCEYLILGQHYIGEEWPDGTYVAYENDRPEHLQEYVDCVVAAIESGVFTYVAHPDIFNFKGDAQVYTAQMRRICQASAQHGVPLEINFLGIREGRSYPREDFWQLAGECGCPVTFGFDSHDPENAYDGASLSVAEEMVRKFGLNYIGRPELVLIQDL
ncbi:MAG: histidinol-phosphatase [Oscillospiraceae bacterium]|nr:histidinol-phosphatase [Oscillospiraceae bacterium]